MLDMNDVIYFLATGNIYLYKVMFFISKNTVHFKFQLSDINKIIVCSNLYYLCSNKLMYCI